MASIYDLDPNTKNLLSLDTFLRQITVQEFIEGITADRSIQESNSRSAALDPRPYVRAFEASLDALAQISADLNSREQKIQTEARQAGAAHQAAILKTEAQCHTLTGQFSDLDLLVSDVASTTTALGEAVDLVSRQRNRAASSSFIIKCYISFLENDNYVVEKMRTGNFDDQRQCAITVRQLLRVARKITKISNADVARANIEKYAEMLEMELLKAFERAYRAADMTSMKAVAEILTEFNGGSSVIKIFVNQHDFFIMKDKLLHESVRDDDLIWQDLCDPNCEDPPFDPATVELLDEIRITVKKESQIIKRVFPHPDSVLRVFLQRLFAQTIQQRIELILSHAKSISTLAYLRTLQNAHSYIGQLVQDLKEILHPDLEILHPDIDAGGGLAMLLDQNMQDVFVPYIENRQYIDMEKRNLKELNGAMLWRFNNYYAQKRPAATVAAARSNNTLLNKLASGKGRDLWKKKESKEGVSV
ncbi:exocyst complex component Sec10-domain-containing protein [Myxozyma melibiosi]|uniref:Exocyst complex component Sec10-domain-containing protein n=1 Tax=Myxozyma melibiosi TaxID=54550 RepID=A0ABR1EY61_9ASCO